MVSKFFKIQLVGIEFNPFTPRLEPHSQGLFFPRDGGRETLGTRLSINVAVPFESVDDTLVCDHSNERYILSSTFMWCCLFLTILQNEIDDFSSVLNLALLGVNERVLTLKIFS